MDIFKKYVDFVKKMNFPVNLESSVVYGGFVILESVATTVSTGTTPNEFTPTIFKAPPHIKNEYLKELSKFHSKKMKSFLNKLNVNPRSKKSLMEGFEVLLEEYTWLTSDPSQMYSFGGQGYEMLGIPNRPLWDTYYPFKIAPGGSDMVTSDNSMDAGFGGKKATDSGISEEDAKFKFPEFKPDTNKDVQKLISNGIARTPNKKATHSAYAPWWHYYHFFNTQNFST